MKNAHLFVGNVVRWLFPGLLLALLVQASMAQVSAQTAILAPGRAAAPAGSQTTFSGRNFTPGETVTFSVTHLRGTPTAGTNHTPAQVVADPGGAFTATWLVCSADCVGEMLKVEATGQTSGRVGRAVFLDMPAPPASATWLRTDKADYPP